MPGENGYNVALYLTKWASEWIVMCFCDKWRRDVTSGHVTHSPAIDTLMPTRAQVWIVLTCRTDSVERALTLHFCRKVDTACCRMRVYLVKNYAYFISKVCKQHMHKRILQVKKIKQQVYCIHEASKH